LWLYRIQDASSNPILLISRDSGQSWEQAVAQQDVEGCPVFELKDVNVAEIQPTTQQVSTSSPAFDLSFSATPNPFAESLRLQFPMIETGAADITIFNAGGQRVYHRQLSVDQTGPQTLEIPSADWAAGTYLVTVQTPDQTWKEKLIHIH
ncbi:MAG: T9SS type A sorting domain-containing protein, partial [Bacteroidota bacterium]